MNENDIICLMDMIRNYLNSDVAKLSKRVNEDIIENLMLLNSTIYMKDFSYTIDVEQLNETYELLKSASEVKGVCKPLFTALEHSMRDYLTDKGTLHKVESLTNNDDKLRSYELSRYSKLIESVCGHLIDKPKNGLESLSLEKLNREKAIEKVTDMLILNFFKNRRD